MYNAGRVVRDPMCNAGRIVRDTRILYAMQDGLSWIPGSRVHCWIKCQGDLNRYRYLHTYTFKGEIFIYVYKRIEKVRNREEQGTERKYRRKKYGVTILHTVGIGGRRRQKGPAESK